VSGKRETRFTKGAGFPPTDIPLFTPSATLASAIDELTEEIVVVSGPDSDRAESVSTPDFAQCAKVAWLRHTNGLEGFIAFRDVVHGDGTLTLQILARGAASTPPRPRSMRERACGSSPTGAES